MKTRDKAEPTPSRVLVVAPHVIYPIRNGADKYIVDKWMAVPEKYAVVYLFADGVYERENGHLKLQRKAKGYVKSNINTVLQFILSKKQYMECKFFTREISALLEDLAKEEWDLVVCSFATLYPATRARVKKAKNWLIESHNVDPKIYADRADEVSGVRKNLYRLAGARSKRALESVPSEVSVCALGDADAKLLPMYTSARVHVGRLGYRVTGPRHLFPEEDYPVIAFVGSLDIQMNVAALLYFFRGFYPDIKRHLPSLRVRVVGSNPAQHLRDELSRHGTEVTLHANVTDAELADILTQSHATFIPFEQQNGLKLKAATSLQLGVPVISMTDTQNATESGVPSDIYFCSNRPDVWAEHILHIMPSERQRELAQACLSFCQRHSWQEEVIHSMAHAIGDR